MRHQSGIFALFICGLSLMNLAGCVSQQVEDADVRADALVDYVRTIEHQSPRASNASRELFIGTSNLTKLGPILPDVEIRQPEQGSKGSGQNPDYYITVGTRRSGCEDYAVVSEIMEGNGPSAITLEFLSWDSDKHQWIRVSSVGRLASGGTDARNRASVDSELTEPLAQFYIKHPAEAKQYAFIHPTTTDMAERLLTTQSALSIMELRSFKSDFPQDPAVAKHVDAMIAKEQSALLEKYRWLENLNGAKDESGLICEYERRDGGQMEEGVLVIKSGDVVKSEPWLTDIIAPPFVEESMGPVAQFYAKHPSEAKQYSFIRPTTTEMAEQLLTTDSTALLGELKGLKNRFPDDLDVNKYADLLITRTNAVRLRTFEYINDFKSAGADGGVICDYQWSDGKTKEIGLLVIKAGEIVKRKPWITDVLETAPTSR